MQDTGKLFHSEVVMWLALLVFTNIIHQVQGLDLPLGILIR